MMDAVMNMNISIMKVKVEKGMVKIIMTSGIWAVAKADRELAQNAGRVGNSDTGRTGAG